MNQFTRNMTWWMQPHLLTAIFFGMLVNRRNHGVPFSTSLPSILYHNCEIMNISKVDLAATKLISEVRQNRLTMKGCSPSSGLWYREGLEG